MDENEEFDPMKSRWGFITFRAHVCETQVFEDFINIFLPILSTFTHYAYSIEEDNTPNRHIHCIFNLTSSMKDKSKIDQKFNNKFMKDFKKSLPLKQTQWAVAYDSKLIENTKEDFLKVLGYCIKDDNVSRRRIKNIPTNFLTQGIKFHVSTARNEDNAVKNDIKIITSKNFHVSCEQFAEKNNMTVHDWELIPKMTHQRHSFQISARDLKKYESELRFMNSEYDPHSKELIHILAHREEDGLNENEATYLQKLEEKYKQRILDIHRSFNFREAEYKRRIAELEEKLNKNN